MTPQSLSGLATVTDRIARIEQRFAAPTGFAATLARAEQAQAGAAPEAQAGTQAGAQAQVATQGLRAKPLPARGLGTAGLASTAAVRRSGGLGAPAPDGAWVSRLPERGRQWAGAIDQAARDAGVEPELLAALVWAESAFRADARSHAGALGLAQLMPGTAAGLGVDPHDPQANLRGGARYLAAQIDRFGRVDHALAAYNAGPGRVVQYGGIPPFAETQAYVPRVLGYYSQLSGPASATASPTPTHPAGGAR